MSCHSTCFSLSCQHLSSKCWERGHAKDCAEEQGLRENLRTLHQLLPGAQQLLQPHQTWQVGRQGVS